jgi:hypothetical protein
MLKMNALRGAAGAALVVIAALACGSSPDETLLVSTAGLPTVPTETESPVDSKTESPPLPASTTETTSPPIAPTVTQPADQQAPAFGVAVIVDTQSEAVGRDQAQAVIGEASRFLRALTPIDLVMTDFVEDPGGGSSSDIASRYIGSHATGLPSGLVIFSFGDAGQAKSAGGYSYAISGPAGFRNPFVSPVTGGSQIYVAVVHFSHKYAPCGYGTSESVQQTTSINGECRNQPGTACVQQNGYSMCSDSVGHLYASTPTYFAASTIVHQLVQLFSPGGDKDHFSTPECNTRMGYPRQFHDLQEDQYHNGLCPYVYEEFRKSFQP